MTEIGEGSASAVIKEEVPEKNEKQISVRCSVFFDGTLNNRANIDARLITAAAEELTDEERAVAVKLKGKKSASELKKAAKAYQKHSLDIGGNEEGEENSYENYYSNIALMEQYLDEGKNYDLTLKTYIEGSGTLDEEGDKKLGYAFAIAETGIAKKVEKGVSKVVNKIKREHFDTGTAIKKLTLDVFGFSRGAAAARNFVHETLDGDNTVKKQLEALGYTVNEVEVCFVGLYDTVSSQGIIRVALSLSNTKNLKLNAIAKATRVIQLASADEHRKYFCLTDISSARGDSKEIFLPGTHSDIGGGYRDYAHEKQTVFKGGNFSLAKAKKEQTELVAAGWYKEAEISLEHIEFSGDHGFSANEYTELNVKRPDIRNGYSRIPLQLMAGYARESGINIRGKLKKDEAVPPTLSDIKTKIDNYIANSSASSARDWQGNDYPWLNRLRHDYFHFSARHKIGHSPRYYRGKRARKTFKG